MRLKVITCYLKKKEIEKIISFDTSPYRMHISKADLSLSFLSILILSVEH